LEDISSYSVAKYQLLLSVDSKIRGVQ